ncbi:MAG: hypothetical protein ABSH41_30160 [Syntrophobacteraceae bacterium]
MKKLTYKMTREERHVLLGGEILAALGRPKVTSRYLKAQFPEIGFSLPL